MKYDEFTWDDIILEAPGDDTTGDDSELSPTDYAESEDLDIEEADPADDTEVSDDSTEEDNTNDAESDIVDDSDDPLNDDPLADENDEDDMNADDSSNEEQTDNSGSDIVSDKQNINLVNDFIELYQRIDIIMNQMRINCTSNVKYNKNILVVKQNLTKLKEITYDYITNKFAKESYITNLYQFNLIIQALNVNIDLFDSVLHNTNRQNDKKSKKNK